MTSWMVAYSVGLKSVWQKIKIFCRIFCNTENYKKFFLSFFCSFLSYRNFSVVFCSFSVVFCHTEKTQKYDKKLQKTTKSTQFFCIENKICRKFSVWQKKQKLNFLWLSKIDNSRKFQFLTENVFCGEKNSVFSTYKFSVVVREKQNFSRKMTENYRKLRKITENGHKITKNKPPKNPVFHLIFPLKCYSRDSIICKIHWN